MEDYFQALDNDPEQKVQCERILTVSISCFFRDCALWRAQETQIFPAIIVKKRGKPISI